MEQCIILSMFVLSLLFFIVEIIELYTVLYVCDYAAFWKFVFCGYILPIMKIKYSVQYFAINLLNKSL